MREHTRNVLVGLTVLVALLMLGGMILLFAGLPSLLQRGWVVRMYFPATADAHENDPVHLAGMQVGKIVAIGFADGDPRKGVELTARIDRGVLVPGDVQPTIFTRGFIGGAYIELVPGRTPRADPATGQPLEFLPEDWGEPLVGKLKGSGLFPEEMSDALSGLATLANNLNELVAPSTAPADTQPGATQPAPSIGASLRESLAKLTRVLDGLDSVLGDEENQANLKKSLAGLAKATQGAGEAMASLKSLAADVSKTSGEARLTIVEARRAVAQIGKTAKRFSGSADTLDRQVERVATRLIEGADKLAGLLATLNRTVTKIEAGEGTAGKLLNDPKLYNNLLEAIDQLTKLMGQLRRTVEHWQANGIPLKMAK